MVQLTKKQIRKDLIENLGQIFFEERKKRKLTLKKLSMETKIPIIQIELIELGKSFAIGKIIRLITFYNKKLKVEMTD